MQRQSESTAAETTGDAAAPSLDALDQLLASIENQLSDFEKARLFRWGSNSTLVLGIVGGVGLAAAILWNVVGWRWGVGLLAFAGALLACALPLARRLVSRRLLNQYQPIWKLLQEVDALCLACSASALEHYQQQREGLKQDRDRALQSARERSHARRRDALRERNHDLRGARDQYPRRLDEIQRRYETDLAAAHALYPPRLERMKADHADLVSRLDREHQARQASAEEERRRQLALVSTRWSADLARLQDEAERMARAVADRHPDWNRLDADGVAPVGRLANAVPFGAIQIDPDALARDGAADALDDLQAVRDLRLPALIDYPRRGSIWVTAPLDFKEQARSLLSAVMLRMLLATPPGKLRFTIIDPVGLGEGFAAFMHLADVDESLVTTRIWTETVHIERRLSDLTEYMETVIQKYLRDEFDTLDDYNAQAGEIAEPYRVLVVANFPTNFQESSARRLLSIVQSGHRCGISTLIWSDTKLAIPGNISLADLQGDAVRLAWKQDRFVWENAVTGGHPLSVLSAPSAEIATRLLKRCADAARDANKVEVPFERVVPDVDHWWTESSQTGLNVPLGPSGATRLVSLRLGKGTSQHVLIAGKTGSGKSTLLHVLITNVALRYSPDEVELYLIDFKKGVEFKPYALHELPHARVIAIESEREFGLSVMQRLDALMQERGELFRERAVQDLAGYRDAAGTPLPRVLLIVDEFQELFTEDDKIAQESSLLLDRLVRQGRAFGIHVLLGSQTLGGAYSLARSTIGQMAVRIALQCSEADAHLILSESNSAARLLSRPGEAIYNDANGTVEGNNPFQIAWISDERRDEYLARLQSFAAGRKGQKVAGPIVFEGNLPADPRRNVALTRLLASAGSATSASPLCAWLGDAVAIKEPTCVQFRRQSGSNLLLIGQQATSAGGIVGAVLVSLSASSPPADANGSVRYLVLSASSAEHPSADAVRNVALALPNEVQFVERRAVAEAMGRLAELVQQRVNDPAPGGESVFLVLFDLQRFRDLRRAEDDFGFGRDEAPSPPKLLAQILRDGPGVGVHTIIWCDSANNLNRSLDRATLREFDLKVLFQMSAVDSSNLIDSPSASRLGPNRAIFVDEDLGISEKFRPYGLADEAWLNDIRSTWPRRPVASGGE